jgi:hypothetical protein
MASERQIEANRRNAKKSTGPKSDSAKKRSSKNAYQHGLSVPMSAVESEARLKELARQFAGDTADAGIFALAETAADAHLDLERVRRVQTAMIERALSRETCDAEPFDPNMEELRQRFVEIDWAVAVREATSPPPEMIYSSKTLPGGKEEEERRFAEAVQRILPELTKTCRYEKQAAGRRDRAISKIASIKSRSRRIVTPPPGLNA